MWRPDDDIDADLASGDPTRAAAGIVDLWDRMEGFDPYPRPVFDPPGALPEPAQLRMVELLGRYPFEPPIPDDERRRRFVALALAQGTPQVVLEVSLRLKATPDAVPATVAALGTAPLDQAGERRAAWLVEHLLGGPPAMRRAVIGAVRAWPASTSGLARRVAVALTPEERG